MDQTNPPKNNHDSRTRSSATWIDLDETHSRNLGPARSGPDPSEVGRAFTEQGWRSSVNVLIQALHGYKLSELCGGPNRDQFLRLVQEYAGFRTALLDHLLNTQNLKAVQDWITLSDPQSQQWMVKNWYQLASNEKRPHRAARLYAAVGAGLFEMNEWDNAWRQWTIALEKEPALLQPITSMCKKSPRMDMRKAQDRMRIIHLIAAAGKHKESMSLIQALGMEHPKNALVILTEMPSFIPFDANSREVAQLRFNLAMYLQKKEIVLKVIGELENLDQNDLFDFRKQMRNRIKDVSLRRAGVMEFAKIYIKKEEWELAAGLLESIFQETPTAEIISLMVYVTDRYPILSRLHFIIGKYYLEAADPENALKHLSLVGDVKEYKNKLIALLETYLDQQINLPCAHLLLSLLPEGTHKASLIAMMIVLNENEGLEQTVNLIASWKSHKQPSPFWFLALLHGSNRLEQFNDSHEILLKFLINYSTLAPEAVKPAEYLLNHHQADFSQVVQLLDTFGNVLEPKSVWASLKMRFTEATRRFHEEPEQVDDPVDRENEEDTSQDIVPKTETLPPEDSNSNSDNHNPTAFGLEVMGELQHDGDGLQEKGPKVEEKAQKKTETDISEDADLSSLEQQAIQHSREVKFTLHLLQALLDANSWQKAVLVGRRALENAHFRSDLSAIYQLTAEAYEGLQNETEALRFFCLASREDSFYQQNRERLTTYTFPDNTRMLQEVLQLVLVREDYDTWSTLMTEWHRRLPDQIDRLLQAQAVFVKKTDLPRAVLDLAFWKLQAGKLQEVDDILEKINLRDEEIREALVHISNLASLKYPNDPKPRFVLARYYLAQDNVNKAVNTFRDLAKTTPSAAQPIFRFLQNYLKKNPDSVNLIYLYGLLIRFALSYGTPMSAVKLLEEYGSMDCEGALSLTEGIFRVIMGKENKLEVVYELGKLMFKWQAWKKMLKVNDEGELGAHMAIERQEWFKRAMDIPDLRDRAILSSAYLYHETADFDSCRHTLAMIRDRPNKSKSLALYSLLLDRFPEDADLLREAGWAAFLYDKDKAKIYFSAVFELDRPENWIEAFAVLQELGDEPDPDRLNKIAEDEDRIYGALREIYDRIREMELNHWEKEGGSTPVRSLEWLLTTGSLKRFQNLLPKIHKLPNHERNPLEARYFRAMGLVVPAAWRMAATDEPVEVRQSFFCDAGLYDQAVCLKPPKQRLPQFIRNAFIRSYREPSVITVTWSRVKALQEQGRHEQTHDPDADSGVIQNV